MMTKWLNRQLCRVAHTTWHCDGEVNSVWVPMWTSLLHVTFLAFSWLFLACVLSSQHVHTMNLCIESGALSTVDNPWIIDHSIYEEVKLRLRHMLPQKCNGLCVWENVRQWSAHSPLWCWGQQCYKTCLCVLPCMLCATATPHPDAFYWAPPHKGWGCWKPVHCRGL